MDVKDYLLALLTSEKSSEIEALIDSLFEQYSDRIKIVPVGNRDNNRGQVEIGTDPGKGIVERITNGIDAVLELEHDRHNGRPECRSPREAAVSWLNVPSKGLYELSPAKRRELASSIVVTISAGDDKTHRTISITDSGIGLKPEQMPSTILSLGESNKVEKLYLAGAFGQGGSSTFVWCKYSVVCSRLNSQTGNNKVGFTIVYYEDLPPEKFKHGRYVYLTLDGKPFEAELSLDEFRAGSLVRHYGYDITEYKHTFGPQSVYGLLQRALFDPIIPIMLEDKVHKIRRVIKGSRNALNGALDDADERGPTIQYNVPLYHVSLGEHGNIGLEYWVLEESGSEKYEPTKAYVDNRKPILLTVNGQTHAEFSGTLAKNRAELPYLRNRLIIHVDCNSLTHLAKRNLFSSSREDARKGEISKLIEEEIAKALKSDDQLKILNEDAKNLTLKKTDDESEKLIKGEVAKVLRFHGYTPTIAVAGSKSEISTSGPSRIPPIPKTPTHRITKKIDIRDPPTYVKILADSPIDFYPEQRRYMRIETDAPSTFHNAEDLSKSKFNIILTDGNLTRTGTTPLKEGRMRIVIDCPTNAKVDATGEITVELSRPGMSSLSAKVSYLIVQKPPPSTDRKQISIPEIHFVPVENPDDENWVRQSWPNDFTKVASSSELGNELVVYYSTIFPAFADAHRHLQKTNLGLASSFANRYKMWLAVHSLLLEQSKKEAENLEEFELWEREERCRLATMASLVADKEIRIESQLPVKEIE